MASSDAVIIPEVVHLDVDCGATPAEVIAYLAESIASTGRASDATLLAADATAREEKSGTGVPGRVAIPHCRSESVSLPTLAFARLSRPVDFSGPDGDASLVFLIAAPAGAGKAHLKILSKLARALVRKDFLESLRTAQTAEELTQLVLDIVSASPAKTATAASTASSADSPATTTNAKAQHITRIIAITACPTGIAHTYMAADALTQEANQRPDIELTVETQGSSAITPIAPDIIAAADAVIFATDVGVKDRERFAGKPVIESGVKRAINDPGTMLDEAQAAAKNPQAPRVAGNVASGKNIAEHNTSTGLSWGKRIQQAVMTGVSYMVPFVAAGGLLIAIGFLLGGEDIARTWENIATQHSLSNLPDGSLRTYLAAVIFATGNMGMQFVVAALSGYIAYALANRPGIAPGFIGGAISVLLDAGFIGGLVTGIIAGLVAMWIGSWPVPRWVASLMPVVIIPLLTSLIVGISMFFLLGQPLALIMEGMQNWLNSMSGSSAVLLGIILGLMMCFDLGGPVNKAAYLFATAGLSTGDDSSMMIMAAVMGAGMVPPIALSLATVLRAKLFSQAEQENGKSSWLLGLSFVSEGAIPFAASDPFRVIPAMMAGGAVTGAVSMTLGVGSSAPHGGIFVIAAVSPAISWLLALAAGIIVSTVAVILFKQIGRSSKAMTHSTEVS